MFTYARQVKPLPLTAMVKALNCWWAHSVNWPRLLGIINAIMRSKTPWP